jgi:hypothetical protein
MTVELNETVTEVPNYEGHWHGLAFITHHRYGHQVHRTREDAERWNAGQREVRPARSEQTCTPYPDHDECPA